MPNTLHILPFRRNHKHGFTLVELMIVIAIIGLLAVALLPKLIGAQSNTRDVARKKDLQTIAAALEQVYDERGRYPVASYSVDTKLRIPITNWYGGCISTNTGITAPYLSEKLDKGKAPLDPSMQRNGVCGDEWAWMNRRVQMGAYVYYGLVFSYNPPTNPFVQWYSLQANMENYHNANTYSQEDDMESWLGHWRFSGFKVWGTDKPWVDLTAGQFSHYNSAYSDPSNQEKDAKESLQAFKDSLKPIEEKRPTHPYTDFPADYRFVIIKDHILEP